MEDAHNRLLEYLKKEGQANTFRLARKVGIPRHKLLGIIKELEEKQAIEFRRGMVVFLKFPAEEKKARPVEVKKHPLKPKKGVAKRKLNVLKNLQKERLKRLPKLEASIRMQPNIKTLLKEQTERIEKLEGTIKGLQRKASTPKVIRKTIVKKVPVEELKVIKTKEKEAKPQKIKLPKINICWLKGIQQLKRPKFMERKINVTKLKVNFAKLNKNIRQLSVPEVLKRGG